MHILSSDQIRQWDAYTIREKPVSPLQLMEQAARACTDWLMENRFGEASFMVVCGKGNNGGDGLCIARQLHALGRPVQVCILEFGHMGTAEFQHNLERLHEAGVPVRFISSEEALPQPEPGQVIVEALFGTGLTRPIEGLAAALIRHLNRFSNPAVSIDMPSGMYADRSSKGNPIFAARHTLTFQCMRLCFLMAENAPFFGQVHLLDIGLLPEFLNTLHAPYHMVDAELAANILRPRPRFAHKGIFGHGALVCGSRGMWGAALLSAKAFLRSGAGKLTCHLTRESMPLIQSSVPEAMVRVEPGETCIAQIQLPPQPYNAIGIGPGLGRYETHPRLLRNLFAKYPGPLVLDADALNTIAAEPDLKALLRSEMVLTPHPGEFDRLFPQEGGDFGRMEEAVRQARQYRVVIVLKGAYTLVATPGGAAFFNGSGNPGMAKGGSGDALTGLLTGLLTQGYPAVEAAILGVYLHGLAGDLALLRSAPEALLPGDLIRHLGAAFNHLHALSSGKDNIG